MVVPLPQDIPGLLLETIAGLLPVPYGPGQRELPPDPVLAHGTQRPSPLPLRLDIVRLHPQSLQLRMRVRGERMALQDPVEFLEVAPMVGHQGLCLQDRLVPLELLAGGQGPQEPAESVDVPGLLEHLADARYLFLREAERREIVVVGAVWGASGVRHVWADQHRHEKTSILLPMRSGLDAREDQYPGTNGVGT